MSLTFAKTDSARHFCNRVMEALVCFCGKSDEQALALIQEFWANDEDMESDEMLYHEPPYYYALCIAHHPVLGDGYTEWYLDDQLWPPPPGWRAA